jgi:hypothetical protein
MDADGNGSMCFEQYVGTGNQDLYYYGYVEDAWLLPTVAITLTPVGPPIIIPATGGNFSFTGNLLNESDSATVADIWTEVIMPNGSPYGPIINVSDIGLPGGGSRTRIFQQFVPASAPAGDYFYVGYAGIYPNGIASSDTFAFTKLGIEIRDSGSGEWSYSGELFTTSDETFITHNSPLITSVSPNPFNPMTAISYQLAAYSYVRLQVYDTAGRLVATLVDGRREAGMNSALFDGSGLASGLYFARLQADGYAPAIQKLLLVK